MTLPDVALTIGALACLAGWVSERRTRKTRAKTAGSVRVVITADVSQALDALAELSAEVERLVPCGWPRLHAAGRCRCTPEVDA